MADKRGTRTAGYSNAAKDKLREESLSSENSRDIELQHLAAKHFYLAAKFHEEAAKLHAEGNHERASESVLKAIGHSDFAHEYQKDYLRHQVEGD